MLTKTKYGQEYFDEICDVMSRDRLTHYQVFMPGKLPHLGIVITPYIVIQQASSMLLPTLQFVEVALRNRMDASICSYFTKHPNPNGNDSFEWYNWLPQKQTTKDEITKSIQRATKETKSSHPTHGDIVAHIPFGTWISVLVELHKLDRYTWREICNNLFMRSGGQKLPSVGYMISVLREMNNCRNRLFHHEPIWSHGLSIKSLDDAESNIQYIHDEAITCISWLSPCLHDFYTTGAIAYDTKFSVNLETSFKLCKMMSQISISQMDNTSAKI